jgi:polysaccharide export outer membrane protein
MRSFSKVLILLFLFNCTNADDNTGVVGGGDNSGLGDYNSLSNYDLSGLGGENNTNSATNNSLTNNNQPNLIVPINGDNGNSNSYSLNLNNQIDRQFNFSGINSQTDNQIRKNTYGGLNNKFSKYNGIDGYEGSNNNYVPSVFGNGYVLNPLSFQDQFQKNVQIRSGIFLPMIGYNLFTTPTDFTPVKNIPVDANYTLGPGDEINIQAWGAINIDYTVTIDTNGTIFIPKIGNIVINGIKASDLNDYLDHELSKLYRNFKLFANVGQIRSIGIKVAGYATKPGTYQLSALSDISNAVFAVGGPSLYGSLRNIQIKRNGKVITDFDMYPVILNGDNSNDVRLLPGDIIYFAPKGNQVAIYDGVKIPGIYEAKNDETVNDIIKFAGGLTYNNTQTKTIIEQINKEHAIDVHSYPFAQSLNQVINNGDIIHFFTANNVYENSIVLIGNVAYPSRYNYESGMRISDIIPNKKMLLTKSFWNSYSYNSGGRDNLLTQIGGEKTISLFNSDANTIYSTGLTVGDKDNVSPSLKVFDIGDNLFTAGPIQIPEANINWSYATIIRLNKQTLMTNVIPFNLAKAIARESANDLLLQPGDIIDIFSSRDVRSSTSDSIIYVFIDGEVKKPGVYELKPNLNLIDLINMAGGISSNAYLYGTEINRDSVKQKQKSVLTQMIDQLQQTLLAQSSNATVSSSSQNQLNSQAIILKQQQSFLNKLRQIKPTGRIILGLTSAKIDLKQMPKILLENGDTVYIPSRPSTVDVIGQVFNPATFMYNPDKSVKNYIEMAGTENSFADTSNEYILRADGTIYSKQQAGWFGSFSTKSLNPGDAIVVPQQIQFTSAVQDLLNLTQILANTAQTTALFYR